MNDSDEHIPTLDEMIFPGRHSQPDANREQTNASEPPPIAEPLSDSGLQNVQSTEQQPQSSREKTTSGKSKRTNFETMVNRQVDAILARHMKAARAEIVRAVMLELRSRLPVTKRKKD